MDERVTAKGTELKKSVRAYVKEIQTVFLCICVHVETSRLIEIINIYIYYSWYNFTKNYFSSYVCE